MDDLFPESETTMLSPRLAWMAKPDVATVRNAAGKWFAVITEDCVGSGGTEIEALEDLCERAALRHWSL